MAGVLSYALTLSTSGFTGPLGAAGGALRGFGGGVSSLAGKLTSLPVLLSGAAAGAGLLGTAFSAFKQAADMESTVASFATLMGSTEKAESLLSKLERTAASTPNTLNELAQSTRSLLAVSDDENIIADLRMIGDLASASQKPITDLASMYAKIKGGDLVQGEDLNMLSDALGGGALKEFQKVLGVDSVAAVRKLGSEGKISGAVLDQVFRNLTAEGGMAFGAMAAQSKTTNGLLSTLKDNVSSIMRTLGEPINDFLKPMLSVAIARAQTFGIQLKGMLGLLKEAKDQGRIGEFLGAGLQLAATGFVNSIYSGWQKTIAYVSTTLPQLLTSAKDIIFGPEAMRGMQMTFWGLRDIIQGAFAMGASKIARTFQLDGLADKLQSEADVLLKVGKGMMDLAGKQFAKVDGAEIGKNAATALEQANLAGKEAAGKAGHEELIDTKAMQSRFEKIGSGINPEFFEMLSKPQKFLPKLEDAKDRGDVKGLTNALKDTKEEVKKVIPKLGDSPISNPLPKLGEQTKTRGLKDLAESALARINRASDPDKALSNTDRLGLLSLGRKRGLDSKELDGLSSKDLAEKVNAAKKSGLGGQLINPKRAAEALARANGAADPRSGRGGAAADPAAKANETLLEVVKEIRETFSYLATA